MSAVKNNQNLQLNTTESPPALAVVSVDEFSSSFGHVTYAIS